MSRLLKRNLAADGREDVPVNQGYDVAQIGPSRFALIFDLRAGRPLSIRRATNLSETTRRRGRG